LEIFDLEASERKSKGKGPARALRRQGFIPAVLYGPGTECVHLAISTLEVDKMYQERGGEQAILNLIIKNGGTQKRTAIVKELQTSPVSNEYLHVDFCEISLDKELTVKVQVELTGKSKGVEEGGLLQLIRYELEVFCLPVDIPRKIEVDVSNLDIGDSVHVEDIAVGEKVRLLYDTNFTVATVVAPTVVEEKVSEEELEEAEETPAEAEAEG
jgi:large subunit ribosomal protein L25